MAAKASKAQIRTAQNQEEKRKALDVAVSHIEKSFGKGSIMKLGESGVNKNIETVPTGSLSLDIALGAGGFPRGRIIEIYGPESSGKTTLALHAVAEVQKRGGIAGFVDAEHALDPRYAERIGVDIDNLYVSQPDSGEQALEIAETMARSGAVDILVIDSVAALVPKAEIDGEMGDSHVGLQARLMSQALRKLTSVVSRTNCIMIFINQLREKVGVMFGNPETTTGGRALKFYASVRLEIRRIETLKVNGVAAANRVRVKVAKNKIAPPFKVCEFDISFGDGISKEGDVLDLAVEQEIVEKSGAWFSYKGNKIGQGRENTKEYLRQNPDVLQEIDEKVREKFGLTNSAAPGDGGEEGTSDDGSGAAPAPVQATPGRRGRKPASAASAGGADVLGAGSTDPGTADTNVFPGIGGDFSTSTLGGTAEDALDEIFGGATGYPPVEGLPGGEGGLYEEEDDLDF